jgi:4-carboxymuconolactone decarboxylase
MFAAADLLYADDAEQPGAKAMPIQASSPAREAIRGTVPKLAEISDTVIYGEIWERPGLSKRDRSLIVVATLIALGRERQLEGHLARALANGVTKDEIGEIITHLAFYAGWPAAMTAATIAKDVFEKQRS